MPEVQFTDDPEARKLIRQIATRAIKVGSDAGVNVDRQSTEMDLAAVHVTCPLDLQKLLDFDDFNLAHDVFGIARHLDRATGELTGCFLPRCARPVREAA